MFGLYNYLLTSKEEGGCCHSVPLYRATFVFVIIFTLFHFVGKVFISIHWCTKLNVSEETSKFATMASYFAIFMACLFNLHIFMFGFAPSFHGYFEMQEVYGAFKASISRNIP